MQEYFGTVIPPGDNKFAALNTAVWSGAVVRLCARGRPRGGSAAGLLPHQRREHGPVRADADHCRRRQLVHYVEGCTAPIYSSDSLHSAVVEIIVKEGARVRYTTIQNWANNVYNLVTKRAVAYKNATMEWIDGNLGSKLTMKYPSVYLMGPGAHGEVLSHCLRHDWQHQDAGGKIVHVAPDTTSPIISKSISQGPAAGPAIAASSRSTPAPSDSKSKVRCDALLLDEDSRSDTYPYMEIEEERVTIEHEATVSKIGEEQLFYLMSRGLPRPRPQP